MSSRKMKCHVCYGSGTCPECGGSGHIRNANPAPWAKKQKGGETTCIVCNGTGECIQCNGTGMVEE